MMKGQSAAGAEEEKKQEKGKKSKDDSSSDSEDDEAVGELVAYQPPAKRQTNARTSVSAEVFGKYNKKAEFVPTVIPKSDETK